MGLETVVEDLKTDLDRHIIKGCTLVDLEPS